MDRTLLDEIIQTDYGQFDLTWEGDYGFDGNFDRYFDGRVNGLVGAADPRALYINLARQSGGSPVRIILCDREPRDHPSYQDVVEVSVEIPPGTVVQWMSWGCESHGTLEDLSAGVYRVRVSARDRDAARNGEAIPEPVDAYLIELWPAPKAPDAIIRIGSDDARYWHREIGGRR